MTKLCLVLIFVVESLDSIVCTSAFVPLWALLGICELAQLGGVVVVVSALVLN